MDIKPYFLQKIKVTEIKVSSAAILLGALRVKFNDIISKRAIFINVCVQGEKRYIPYYFYFTKHV